MRILNITKLIVFFALFILTTVVSAQPIEVTASVDKNPVMEDESFILSVVANDDVDRGAFDPSILMKDFTVGSTSVSSQTQMINFDTTRTTTWSTTLIPKKKGRFTIPSFNINGGITKPIEISVVPASASGSGSRGRDLFIKTQLDVEQVYLQEQIRYTVKLYLGKDLQRGSLSSPQLENADIRQIGKDKEYNEILDGKRYRVIERTFAIIPQKSGTFSIEGPLFEGEVIDNSRQSFGFFNRSKAVNRVGPSQTITVLPIPSNYNQHWLPSEFVQLDDEWQGNNNLEFVAGEPITRTITLTAVGVVEEQLPEIKGTYPDSVKIYPDQAETTTVEKDNTLVAQRKETIAIIPSKAGPLVLPEVRIPWFNTITQKTEFAVLPEKTLQILPATAQPATSIPSTPKVEAPPVIKTEQHEPEGTKVKISEAPPYWMWLVGSLIILWLITLMIWWKHVARLKAKNKNESPSTVRTSLSEQSLWKSLEKALNNNDHVKTQKYLALWLGNYIEDKNASLAQSIKTINHDQLTEAINHLLASHYSKHQNQWQGAELHQLLRKMRKNKYDNRQEKENSLSPLHPTS